MLQKLMKKLLFLYNDNLFKYLATAILIAIPLFPKFPFIRVPGTYVSIRLEDFLIAFTSVVFLLRKIKFERRYRTYGIGRAISIFLFIGLLSLVSGILLTKTVTAHIGILHWVRRLEYFLAFYFGVELVETFGGKKDKLKGIIGYLIKVLVLVVVIVTIYGLGQRYFSWPVIVTQNEEYSKGIALRWIPGSHINSTFAGHYDLASFLVLVLPILISTLLLIKKKTSKIVIAATIFGGLWLLANSVSRISVISYLVAVTISLYLIKQFKAIPIVLTISILVFALSSQLLDRYTGIIDVTKEKIKKVVVNQNLNLYVFAQDNENTLERRVNSVPTPVPIRVFEDRSASIRIKVEWPRAVRAFLKNPILGTGYSSITLASDNDYLRALGEIGLVGFFAFVLILLRIIFIQFKTQLRPDISKIELGFISGIKGAFWGIAINAFFIDIFEASKFVIIFWLLMGISIALIKNRANKYV